MEQCEVTCDVEKKDRVDWRKVIRLIGHTGSALSHRVQFIGDSSRSLIAAFRNEDAGIFRWLLIEYAMRVSRKIRELAPRSAVRRAPVAPFLRFHMRGALANFSHDSSRTLVSHGGRISGRVAAGARSWKRRELAGRVSIVYHDRTRNSPVANCKISRLSHK